MDHLQERLERPEQQTHTMAQQLRWWRGTAVLVLGLALISLPLQAAKAQVGMAALTLEQRVAALEGRRIGHRVSQATEENGTMTRPPRFVQRWT